MSASMEWHLSLHGDAHFSNLEMQHSPKMSATFSKKDLQKTAVSCIIKVPKLQIKMEKVASPFWRKMQQVF
jgi:hypothetical protein